MPFKKSPASANDTTDANHNMGVPVRLPLPYVSWLDDREVAAFILEIFLLLYHN
jgi:hypothetical protein